MRAPHAPHTCANTNIHSQAYTYKYILLHNTHTNIQTHAPHMPHKSTNTHTHSLTYTRAYTYKCIQTFSHTLSHSQIRTQMQMHNICYANTFNKCYGLLGSYIQLTYIGYALILLVFLRGLIKSISFKTVKKLENIKLKFRCGLKNCLITKNKIILVNHASLVPMHNIA